MSKNGRHQIETYSFRDLSQLLELNLEQNKPNVFRENLTNLKVLNLNNNKFIHLNVSLMSNLEVLSLANNFIENVSEHDFEFIPHLKSINLDGNRVKSMDLISSFKTFTSVYLSKTQLKYFNLSILNGKTIKHLDLSFNNILIDELIYLNKL